MNNEKLIRFLDAISYETKLGKNLKNTLRKVDKEDLIGEIKEYRLLLSNRSTVLY